MKKTIKTIREAINTALWAILGLALYVAIFGGIGLLAIGAANSFESQQEETSRRMQYEYELSH